LTFLVSGCVYPPYTHAGAAVSATSSVLLAPEAPLVPVAASEVSSVLPSLFSSLVHHFDL
jgi:hypothetical protein